jgi:glycosyltransferase involved in cell wall biosynthesis
MIPRLTIAIPTVNRAALLKRAIESALAQTSRDTEIIVSDNGSTDETWTVIERYADERLRAFRHPSTMSVAKHGWFLTQQAQGEFFLFLSDDDYLKPEFAAEVLALFDRHPELSFVYTGCMVHYGDHHVPALVGPSVEPGRTFLAEHYAGKREVSWCACVTRVRDLREVGPVPEDRAVLGDMFLWTKSALRGPVGCVQRVLSHYDLFRVQEVNNMSHGTPPRVWAIEARLTADETFEASRRSGADATYLSHLRDDSCCFIARSTANQFVWNRLRGASAFQAWGWIAGCLPYLSRNLTPWTRVLAAVMLPRKVLRWLLFNAAAKRAEQRPRTRLKIDQLDSN